MTKDILGKEGRLLLSEIRDLVALAMKKGSILEKLIMESKKFPISNPEVRCNDFNDLPCSQIPRPISAKNESSTLSSQVCPEKEISSCIQPESNAPEAFSPDQVLLFENVMRFRWPLKTLKKGLLAHGFEVTSLSSSSEKQNWGLIYFKDASSCKRALKERIYINGRFLNLHGIDSDEFKITIPAAAQINGHKKKNCLPKHLSGNVEPSNPKYPSLAVRELFLKPRLRSIKRNLRRQKNRNNNSRGKNGKCPLPHQFKKSKPKINKLANKL